MQFFKFNVNEKGLEVPSSLLVTNRFRNSYTVWWWLVKWIMFLT